jgi:uncharacterized membrane protein (TIGR02234 family)
MRSRTLAFSCLLIGGALALIGSGQAWWRATGEGVVLPFSGTQATNGLSQALAIVALAGTFLMLALRARGRRVISVLLVPVGLGLALVGGFGLRPSADAMSNQVHEVSLADTLQLTATVWPWFFAVSGVLVAVGAVITMITAGNWPTRSDRFRPGSGRSEVPADQDPSELWKAMDAGFDPTTDASGDAGAAEKTTDHETATVLHPNVHDRDAGDTMDGTEGRRASQDREE